MGKICGTKRLFRMSFSGFSLIQPEGLTRESSPPLPRHWIPAFAGMTTQRIPRKTGTAQAKYVEKGGGWRAQFGENSSKKGLKNSVLLGSFQSQVYLQRGEQIPAHRCRYHILGNDGVEPDAPAGLTAIQQTFIAIRTQGEGGVSHRDVVYDVAVMAITAFHA
jgi:hypothetical protein